MAKEEKKYYERPIIQRLNTGLGQKFGMKRHTSAIDHIDGHAVASLTEEFGSPLFVISETRLRELYRQANRAFATRYPRVQFAWSYKTNYLDAVCRAFHQEGAWAEVVSGFEYDKAIRNGVPGSQIIFNGPDKREEHLAKAIRNGSMIHIDHLDELMLVHELAINAPKRAKVAIRVNMDTGIHPQWDRFGFNYENGEAWDALQRIVQTGLADLVGLHCHIGTFVLSPSAYSKATKALCDLALRCKSSFGFAPGYLDLGGGFASRNTLKGSYLHGADTAPGFDHYAEAITTPLLNAGFTEDELPLLILETGRALIDDAGYLLGTVIANKRLPDGRGALVLDFGVNLLFTSFWYDHPISPASPQGQATEPTALYGPLCMNIDVIRDNIDFPLLKKGDQVVVQQVGAYNMTQWMQFIHLRPAVVMIDVKEQVHLIRQRETLELVTGPEQIPKHLNTL